MIENRQFDEALHILLYRWNEISGTSGSFYLNDKIVILEEIPICYMNPYNFIQAQEFIDIGKKLQENSLGINMKVLELKVIGGNWTEILEVGN